MQTAGSFYLNFELYILNAASSVEGAAFFCGETDAVHKKIYRTHYKTKIMFVQPPRIVMPTKEAPQRPGIKNLA